VEDVAAAASRANGFLFADLRDYTRYVETHGDHAAAELLASYRSLVRAEIARSAGAEIRTEGDSFYVVFPSASAAIRTALAILEAARAATDQHPDRPIRVGIGVHAGETAETSEGLVGSAVNIAARVCTQAKSGELLVTDVVRGLTRTSLPYTFTSVGRKTLKGISEPVALYRVTVGAPAAQAVGRGPGRLVATSAVVAVVAVMLLTGAWLVFGGVLRSASVPPVPTASPVSAADNSGAPAATRVEQASSAASQAPPVATFPTTAERDLLSRLPLTVYEDGQDNCRRADVSQAAAGAAASVWCALDSSTGASTVIYDQFTDSMAMGSFVDGIENHRQLQQGDCATSQAAWQQWQIPNIGDGKLLCYTDERGHAWDVWTYSSSQLVGRATRDDTNWQDVYAWWQLNAPLLLH
jgi:class 3 adenylate cyclase